MWLVINGICLWKKQVPAFSLNSVNDRENILKRKTVSNENVSGNVFIGNLLQMNAPYIEESKLDIFTFFVIFKADLLRCNQF